MGRDNITSSFDEVCIYTEHKKCVIVIVNKLTGNGCMNI